MRQNLAAQRPRPDIRSGIVVDSRQGGGFGMDRHRLRLRQQRFRFHPGPIRQRMGCHRGLQRHHPQDLAAANPVGVGKVVPERELAVVLALFERDLV